MSPVSAIRSCLMGGFQWPCVWTYGDPVKWNPEELVINIIINYYYKCWCLKWHCHTQMLRGHLTNTKTVTCWQLTGPGISILTKECPEQYCFQLMPKGRQCLFINGEFIIMWSAPDDEPCYGVCPPSQPADGGLLQVHSADNNTVTWLRDSVMKALVK